MLKWMETMMVFHAKNSGAINEGRKLFPQRQSGRNQISKRLYALFANQLFYTLCEVIDRSHQSISM